MKQYTNKLGQILEIVYDESPLNPLEDLCSELNFYTWHSKYMSMQQTDFGSPEDWVDSILGDNAFDKLREKCLRERKSTVEWVNAVCDKLDSKGIFAVPILMFEHSDVKYYLGNHIDRWEGGVAGFAWAYKEDIYKEYGVKRLTKQLKDKLEKRIRVMLSNYSDWCNGYVYGFQLKDEVGEVIDSCYGFFATESMEQMLDDMLGYVETDDINFVPIVESVNRCA